MAIIFELWVESGTETECNQLIKHFDGLKADLLTGRSVSFRASHAYSLETAMSVWSPDLHEGGKGGGLESVLEMSVAGLRLYHHLKMGPPFRFARAGFEAGLVRMEDLGHYLAPMQPGECRLEIECVLDDALYRQMGSPKFCYPFRDGYWWTRYRGERYLPLHSKDQPALNELCLGLFPDYFKW
jgi:hypothetical protein